MYKVFIADSDPVFAASLEKVLSAAYAVASCSDGQTLVQEALYFRPDILILDLMIPYADSIGLLQALRGAELDCRVIVSTRYVSDLLTQQLEELRVDYLLARPCALRGVVARVMELECCGQPPAERRLRTSAGSLLLRLGFGPEMSGYRSLLEGLIYIYENPRCAVFKELYPAVAVRCGTTAAQAEKGMRKCIQRVMENQNCDVWGLYFAAGKDGRVRDVTTSRFLIRMAAVLAAELCPMQELLG